MNIRLLYLLFCLVFINHSASAKGAWQLMTDGVGIDRAVKALSVNDSGRVFAATAGKGMYRSSIDASQWRQTNTGIGSDTDMMSVLVDELGTVFAGSSGGIIYYSDDYGDTWETSFDSGETSDDVNSIASGPLGELYAGTKNGNLYESIDYGFTWDEITSGEVKAGIRSVRVSEMGEIFLATQGMGIYYSEDFGETWTLMNDGLPTGAIVDIRAIEFGQLGGVYAGMSGDGIYKSLDFGLSWDAINNGLGNKEILTMAVDDSNNVIVGTENGVYISYDTGDSWVEINQGGMTNQKVYSLAIGPENELYAGTESGNIYKWDPNFEETLGLILEVAPEEDITVIPGDTATYNIDVTDLKNIPVENAIVEVSSSLASDTQTTTDNQGKATYSIIIPKTTKPGNYEVSFVAGIDGYENSEILKRNIIVGKLPYVEGDWREITNNLPNYKILAIEVAGNGDILAGLSGNGIYRSADNGESWSKSNSGLFDNTTVVRFVKATGGEIYGATVSFGLIKSGDNGNSWTTDLTGGTNILSVSASPDGDIYFLSGKSEIFKSTNGGTDWSKFDSGLDGQSLTYIEAGGDGYIYACNNTEVVYRSNTESPLWTKRTNGLEATKVVVLNASANGKILAGTDDGVFASTDNGETWSKSGTGLDGKSINLIQVAGKTYYTAVESDGVYISKDQGGSWQEFNDGFDVLLTEKEIYSMRYHNSGNLYAGAFGSAAGGGMFQRDVSSISSVGDEFHFKKLFIYPNPANQFITLDLDNSYSMQPAVSIRNILGREMQQNVDFTLSVNNDNIRINLNGLEAGVYFIHLGNENINYIGKFTIINN